MATVVGYDFAKRKKCTCKHCTAIVEYVPSEVKVHNGKDISGGADGYKWVDCPGCGQKIVLESW